MKEFFKSAHGNRSKMYEEIIKLNYMNIKYIELLKNNSDKKNMEYIFIM